MKRLGATCLVLSISGFAACASGEDPSATTLDPTFGDQGNDIESTDPAGDGDGDATASATMGDGDGDPTDTDTDTDSATDTSPGADCGNGVIEDGEQCDGGELGDASCESEGFGGGGLVCTDTCTLDTSNCTACGNGIADADEDCDGDDLGDASNCADINLGGPDEPLGCTVDCSYDFGGCSGCGDGMVVDPEECEPEGDLLDKPELDGQTCESLGFDDGLLDCTQGCTFNTDGCYVCGDAVQQGLEACDGADFGDASCGDYISQSGDPFDAGSLSCSDSCLIDTNNCSLCGDGVVTGGEVCDDGNLDGESCESQGFDGGQLSCANDCSGFVTSACTDCGDGNIEGAEQCDFNNLGGETCVTQGFPGGGTLQCTLECVLDVSMCADNFCGDGQVNGGDECDCGNQGQNCTAAQLDNESCQSLGFDGGALACNSPNNCSYDTASCYSCGDNEINPGEQCDGNNLDGETCQSQGFPGGGQLACTNSCGYDIGGCVQVPNPYTQCSLAAVNTQLDVAVVSQINVPENGTITDVDVSTNIQHTWVGDLDFNVTHGGQNPVLLDRAGVPDTEFGCSENDIDAVFDDEGGGAAEDVCNIGPAIGSPPNYTPVNALSVFDGQDMSGVWTLAVTDNVAGDDGTIVEWCVTVTWQ